jgi:hypothetical protein
MEALIMADAVVRALVCAVICAMAWTVAATPGVLRDSVRAVARS